MNELKLAPIDPTRLAKPAVLLLFILALYLALSLRCPYPRAAGMFEMEGTRLLVRSSALEMIIEGGAIASLKHLGSGETFIAGNPWGKLESFPISGNSVLDDSQHWSFFEGWADRPSQAPEKLQNARRRPSRDSVVRFQQISPGEGRLTYEKLAKSASGDKLTYNIRVDDATGEILIQATARSSDESKPPLMMDLPLVNLTKEAVLLGNGVRVFRNEPAGVWRTTWITRGRYSPDVAVVQGQKGVIFVMPENPTHRFTNIWLAHTKTDDTLILQTNAPHGGLPTGWERTTLQSATWRFGWFPSWVEGARNYRRAFQALSGAWPLWDNPSLWVRQVHVADRRVTAAAQADFYYQEFARRIDPAKACIFNWNGGYLVLFGDPSYLTNAIPESGTIGVLKKYGFNWIGYYPYVLLYLPEKVDERLKKFRAAGKLPSDYSFSPDYAGPPGLQSFYEYFRPLAAVGEYNWRLHPGAHKVQEYLIRNFANYCRLHQMAGAYFDILGGDAGERFAPALKVVEGRDWRNGEAAALKMIRAAWPQLGIMSEYESPWTVPYTFYTWTGRNQAKIVNHPMRTALWGSYTWTLASGDPDLHKDVLLGALPEVKFDLDGKRFVEDEWLTARARLFTGQELFNDLPTAWDPEALAYYRGKDNQWFEFRKMAFGDAYVRMPVIEANIQMGRFIGQDRSPLGIPTRIQDWLGYQAGRPIGLNPNRTYPFIAGPPQPDQVWITDLERGVFISRVSHDKNRKWSVIEFGTADTRPRSVDISTAFHRRALRVVSLNKEFAGPFDPGTQRTLTLNVPGSLIFIWEEPKAVDGRNRNDFLGTTGHNLVNGLPDPFLPYSAYRRINLENATLSGEQKQAICLRPGAHRGWAGQWVSLRVDASPILKFYAGYPGGAAKRNLRLIVQVDGTEVWSEILKPASLWQPRQISLSPYAGRKVLITLGAEELGDTDIIDYTQGLTALLGEVSIDYQ